MSDIKLSHEDAAVVCVMTDVCMSEGLGPTHEETAKLMKWIGTTYPDLASEYWWFKPYYGEKK